MIRQAGLMLPRKEYKEPLYRLRQNEQIKSKSNVE